MKIYLFTLCLGLSLSLPGQTFRWNSDPAPNSKATKVAVDYAGIANVYPDYYDGNPTALGEVFYQEQLTAAHKKLPLGTIAKVTCPANGRTVTVRINDRGAYCDGCVLDLSQAAARQLGIPPGGQAKVSLEVIGASSTTPTDNALTASTGYEPELRARSVAPAAYAAAPPPPHAYERTEERITARTPFSEKKVVIPAANERSTSPEKPRVQAKTGAAAPARAAAVTVIDVPISPFSVQVGAYSKYANAERHALNLQNQGFNNVFILNEPGAGNVMLHRVIIAPFLTFAAADGYVRDLAYHHQIKGLVMQTKLIEVE